MGFDVQWGGGPAQQPVEIRALDAVTRGAGTVPAVAAAIGEPAAKVDRAVTWLAGQGLLTRTQLSEGEHLALTQNGVASVAMQRRLASMVGPHGEIDEEAVVEQLGRTWQAMDAGRTEELRRGQAHVLVDDAERTAATTALQDHYAQGAFDLAELERRTSLALTARTRGDLDAALADLQPTAPAPFRAPAGLPTPMAVLGRGMSLQTARTIRYVLLAVFLVMFGLPMLMAMLGMLMRLL
ncbi:MAG TPA: DUF1707 domain-containing protein [Vicinamibacteria bacterium]|nr:DUF1707 domain-containing protein [Vicinamibacteria bacterium]